MSSSHVRGPSARATRRGTGRVVKLLFALMAMVALSVTAAGGASGDTSDPVGESVTAGLSFEGSKSPTSRLAQTDPALLGRTDAELLNVLVKLDYDSSATYEGGVAGFEATSPAKTGKKLKNNRAAVDRYEAHVATQESAVVSAIQGAVSDETIRSSYRTVYGGVAMQLPANQIDELLAVDGVVAVQPDVAEQPLTTVSPAWIGATSVWPSLGGSSRAGEGVIVGVLDTGIWPEHPSFNDPGISRPAGTFGCQFGNGADPVLGPAFACNDKLIGAYAFMATNMAVSPALAGEFCNNVTKVCSPRDAEGHGTHTSSTAAGSPVAAATLLGVNRGAVSGVAPGAHLIMYRICDASGCFQSDSVAAVQQAILDGVDVINFSISGGRNPFADAVELAFLDAYAAGVLVNASAGNSGPGAGTADHGGPWTNTVAASTSNRHFFGNLTVTASNGDRFTMTGATVTAGIAVATPVVLASEVPGQPNDLCAKPGEAGLPAPAVLFTPGSLAGKIVVCRREVGARVLKSHNAFLGGAAGMILYNGPPNFGLNTDNHWVPSIHLENNGPAGPHPLVTFLLSHTGETATFTGGTATTVPGDVMTAFSSRGPGVDFLKPDITAPGIQILAGHTPDPYDTNFVVGPRDQLYQAIAGTSMASPHAAGASALVKAAHPDWTPGQIKSALMTSSLQSVTKQDGTTPSDPFDRGAGALHVDRAVNPTLTFDETAARYFAAAGDPLGRVHLNVPSINSTRMSGVLRTTRTFKNVSGQPQLIQTSTQAPAGSSISVSPNVIPIAPGESKTVEITIDGTNLTTGQQYFGQITFNPSRGGANDVVMPVAFVKRQGDVTLAHICSPTTLTRDGAPASCTVTAANFASVPATVNIQVSSSFPQKLAIRDVAAPGVATENGLSFTGTLSPALPPQIASLTNGGAPFGFFPLATLGVAPQPGFGDDTLVNFNVNPFLFGTEPYSRVAIASNGYVVMGGGDANDTVTTPQTFPNVNRPNNVLAAYWTDLNPAAGGAIRVAQVTAGPVDRWLVVEWNNVPLFSDPTQRRSAQIWIQQNVEKVTYAYNTQVGAGDAGVGLNVGAENRTGTSGQNLGAIPAANSSLTIVATPPAAGGTVNLAYKAYGLNEGMFDLLATLTSNVTNDATTSKVTITVNK
jgi:subtilisin family serine protease